jgi:hypothetical protein
VKTRSGLVSNSSSSSFCVGSQEGSKMKFTVEIDLREVADEVKTVKELDKYYRGWYNLEKGMSIEQAIENDDIYDVKLEEYQRQIDLIWRGYSLYMINCSNEHDNPTSLLLADRNHDSLRKSFPKNVVVIGDSQW